MEQYIPWGKSSEFATWPAKIIPSGSVEELLKPRFIEAEIKSSGLKVLGVVLDAMRTTTPRRLGDAQLRLDRDAGNLLGDVRPRAVGGALFVW
jgi:hypothetical protein